MAAAAATAAFFGVAPQIAPAGTPLARVFDAEVVESDSGTVEMLFRVELTAPAMVPVILHYETGAPGDTATPGSDYGAAASSLTIDSGDTSGTISIPVFGDFAPEEPEFLTLRVLRAEGAHVLANRVTQQILDGPEHSHFGSHVSLSGNELAVGAYSDRGPSDAVGSIYFYRRSDQGVWELTERFFHPSRGRFGRAVSLDGDQLLVSNEEKVEFYGRGQGGGWMMSWQTTPAQFYSRAQLLDGWAIIPSHTSIRLYTDASKGPLGPGQTLTGVVSGRAGYGIQPHLRKDRIVALVEYWQNGDVAAKGIEVFEPANPDGSWRLQATIGAPKGKSFEVLTQAASAIFAVDRESGEILVFAPEEADASNWNHVQTLPGFPGNRYEFATQIASSDEFVAVSAVIQHPSGMWEARVLNFLRGGSGPEAWEQVNSTTVKDFRLGHEPGSHSLSVSGSTVAMASEAFWPHGQTYLLTPDLATGFIFPDEQPFISIRGTRVREKATEPSLAIFEVYLDQPAAVPVMLDYHTADGTAVAGEDYTPSEGSLTFEAGEVSKTVSVAVLPDAETEGEEWFELRLSNESWGNIIIGSARATIEDVSGSIPRMPVVTIPERVEITEGLAGTKMVPIELVLDAASASPVTARYSLRPKSADLDESDVGLSPGTVTFAPGETRKSVEVAVFGDSDMERDELLEMRIDSEDAKVRGGWGRSQQLQSGEAHDGFATALALSDGWLLVGAQQYFKPTEGVYGLGNAHLFQRAGPDWILAKTFEDPAPGAWKHFGQDVAIWEDTIAISTRADEAGDRDVLLYKRDHGGAGNWGMVARIQTAAREIDSLLLEEDTLLVAKNRDEFSVYSRNRAGPEKWGFVQDLLPGQGDPIPFAYWQVAMRDGLIAIGQARNRTGSHQGSIHLFREAEAGAGWDRIARLRPEAGSEVLDLGSQLAIDHRGRVLASALQDEFYRYEQTGEAGEWTSSAFPFPSDQDLLGSLGDGLVVWNIDTGISLYSEDSGGNWNLGAAIHRFDEGIPESWFHVAISEDGIAVGIRETASLYEPRFTELTILDDDVPFHVFTSDVTTVEGHPTGLDFLVSLSEPAPLEVTMDYATEDGTAKATEGDYIAASGSVTFQPGESEKLISVSVLNDRVIEAPETLFLKLSNLSIGRFLESSAIGTIVDNDGPFDAGTPTVIVPKRTEVRYIVPDSEEWEDVWTMPDYDDSSWASATTPVGYENSGSDYRDLIVTTIDGLFGVNESIYLRIPFTDSNPERFETVLLKTRFDDGFVAYLNGTEISRGNASPGPQRWNSGAPFAYFDSEVLAFTEETVVSNYGSLIDPNGVNILAIQGLNRGVSSTDLLIEQELSGFVAASGLASFHSWLEGFQGIPEDLLHFSADFDQDGLSHLVEYALGLHPVLADSPPLKWEVSPSDGAGGPVLGIFFDSGLLPSDVEVRLEVSYSDERFIWEVIGTATAETSWNLLVGTASLLGAATGSSAAERVGLQPPDDASAMYARLAVTLKGLR